MIFGKVIGTVWSTKKHVLLSGEKFVIVKPYHYYRPTHKTEYIVALDNLDSKEGEDVIVCMGQPARKTHGKKNIPIEASVLGIVDSCQIDYNTASDPDLQFIPYNKQWLGVNYE